MSAIWGYIDFNEDGTFEDVKRINDSIRDGYKSCVIDKFDDYVSESFCIGCGIQYFTKEAESEILPIIDEKRGVFFTADAIVDNREELLSKLGYGSDDKTIPDARILFEMFDRFGEKCLNEILGLYTFVYYDKKNGICHIVNDCIGGRALQYFFENGILYFSTLSKPLCQGMGKSSVNMQWFADFLGLDSLAYCFDFESTPYEGVKRITAASHYCISAQGIKKERYWNPKVSTLKLASDEKYKEIFVKTYKEAVERLVRNDKLTMLLSGGLDSTSIVSLIADSDKCKNVKLRTFTVVPEKKYKKDTAGNVVSDESEVVLQTKEFLNAKGFEFDMQFMTLEGVNSWDERGDQEKILEMPYKSMLNLLWIKAGLEESYKYGSRITLLGSYGNCTVSLGIGDMYLYDLLKRRKYISFLKECFTLGKRYNTSLRVNLKNIREVVKERKTVSKPRPYDLSKTFLDEKAIKKFDIKNRLQKQQEGFTNYNKDIDIFKKHMFNEINFYNATEIRTRYSLMTGAIYRDPTADKRIIELCMSLPASCYAKDGIPRRLVREYLKELMPANTQNIFYYGRQSSDLADRVSSEGNRIYDEIKQVFRQSMRSELIDTDKAIAELERIREQGSEAEIFDILRLEYSAVALEMINNIKGSVN